MVFVISGCFASYLFLFMCTAEALELISTAANHSNAAIRKMVRLFIAQDVGVPVLLIKLYLSQ